MFFKADFLRNFLEDQTVIYRLRIYSAKMSFVRNLQQIEGVNLRFSAMP